MSVIDLQGFQLTPHSFVVKELAFYDINNGYHGRWSFKPPHPWEDLSPSKQKSYAWVTRNLHGMSWKSGKLPYKTFRRILMSLFTSYDIIYVKGLEKANFLKKFSADLNIVNLDCPKIDDLHLPIVKCPFHLPESHYCALQRAAAFAKLLRSN